MEVEKKIVVEDVKVGDLKDDIGNPRKISQKKKNELRESIERFGDFGVIVIDDNNNIISGHQRVQAIKDIYDENKIVHCKRLVGYTENELKAINIKANTHSGEWDMDKLAEWTADLKIDLGLDMPNVDGAEHTVKGMDLIRFEKYDYVMIACRNEVDYDNLTSLLGLQGKKIQMVNTRKNKRSIKARAIWYDQLPVKLVPKEKKDGKK